MAIGERIHFFRKMRGMTLKYLGMLIGFPEKSADVRMAQYETGTRTPKADLTRALAAAFEVSPDALTIPDIDTDIGLMHTLFALEDLRGLTIEMLSAWEEQAEKLKAGEITKEDYDRWRYTYPEMKAQQTKDRLDALRTSTKDTEAQ